MPPSSTPLDHMGDMDGTSARPDLNLEETELPLAAKSHSPTVEDPIEEGKEIYVNPFEEEDLCKAFSDWKKALADLLDLPRRNPPGKLSLSNLERLVKERYIHHELLLEQGWRLTHPTQLPEVETVLDQMSEILERTTKVVDFLVMLKEVLELYVDGEGIRVAIGICSNWLKEAQDSYRDMDRELEVLAEDILCQVRERVDSGLGWEDELYYTPDDLPGQDSYNLPEGDDTDQVPIEEVEQGANEDSMLTTEFWELGPKLVGPKEETAEQTSVIPKDLITFTSEEGIMEGGPPADCMAHILDMQGGEESRCVVCALLLRRSRSRSPPHPNLPGRVSCQKFLVRGRR